MQSSVNIIKNMMSSDKTILKKGDGTITITLKQ